MSSAANKPEPKSTLPQPELNPLVNPILGAHMGRWAEVYFTSAPEKRDEAVLELLRELEGDALPKVEATVGESELATKEQSGTAQQRQDAKVDEEHLFLAPAAKAAGHPVGEIITCRACGQVNPAHHKFCGMCGADIQQGRSHDSPFDPESQVSDWRTEQPARRMAEVPTFAGFSQFDQNPFRRDWASDDGPKLFSQPEPAPYRYRVYVGAALALLVSALVYMAWRGPSAGVGSSHALPHAAPAAATESPAPSQTNPDAKSAAPAATDLAGHTANGALPAATASPSASPVEKASTAAYPAPAAAEPVPGVAQPAPSPQSFKGNGSDELAIAEGYLNGTQGKAKDGAEAAKWLWKSVAKQNAGAALVLSDLYLRGNGVTKSCDQARLLLDAAARKSIAGAAERLRNLPAFGCQ